MWGICRQVAYGDGRPHGKRCCTRECSIALRSSIVKHCNLECCQKGMLSKACLSRGCRQRDGAYNRRPSRLNQFCRSVAISRKVAFPILSPLTTSISRYSVISNNVHIIVIKTSQLSLDLWFNSSTILQHAMPTFWSVKRRTTR